MECILRKRAAMQSLSTTCNAATLKRRYSFGVTAIELLVVLAVMAIIATLAAPSLRNLVINNRLSNLANEFVSSLIYARNEAVKRALPVGVHSVSGTDQFTAGWEVFIDLNNNAVFDLGETVLFVREALIGDTLANVEAFTAITFLPSGALNVTAGTVRTFNLCNTALPASGRSIQVNALGRASSIRFTCP